MGLPRKFTKAIEASSSDCNVDKKTVFSSQRKKKKPEFYVNHHFFNHEAIVGSCHGTEWSCQRR